MSVLNQHTNIKNAGRKANTKSIKPENCPACHKAMNICYEEKDLFYCPECVIHVKDGQIVTVDQHGNYEPPLGHVKDKAQLRVVDKDEKPSEEEQEEPQNLDFYFRSGDKKCFKNLIAREFRGAWMILEKPDGKVVMINSANVNYCEEM